jgi:hypothetical protein
MLTDQGVGVGGLLVPAFSVFLRSGPVRRSVLGSLPLVGRVRLRCATDEAMRLPMASAWAGAGRFVVTGGPAGLGSPRSCGAVSWRGRCDGATGGGVGGAEQVVSDTRAHQAQGVGEVMRGNSPELSAHSSDVNTLAHNMIMKTAYFRKHKLSYRRALSVIMRRAGQGPRKCGRHSDGLPRIAGCTSHGR